MVAKNDRKELTIMTYSKHPIQAGNTTFTFLDSGDLYEATHKNVLINQVLSNLIDGSLNNLYLRVHTKEGIKATPLLGIDSPSTVYFGSKQVRWEGKLNHLQYEVIFSLTDSDIWFWEVIVHGDEEAIDIIYGQDIGIADKGAVRTNEAFNSQYIDHRVFSDSETGYIVCSRQNQPQQGLFPYLQQGSLTGTEGFATDGFQFFGLSYKESNFPEAVLNHSLPNEVYQYEFAYTALQSTQVKLNGTARFVFYGIFKEDHPAALAEIEYQTEVAHAWQRMQNLVESFEYKTTGKIVSPLPKKSLKTVEMTQEEISALYPDRHQEEYNGDQLLSFFTNTHEHVVLKAKELLVERPHGHILMTGNNVKQREDVLTTTSYMYGVFNSQLVVGNTSFNKMLTNTRNALNILKTSGQRLYVEMDGAFHLLGMASLFEMGMNYARWYYKTAAELFVVTNYTAFDTPDVVLSVSTSSGKAYRYLLTNQVSMNNSEYETTFILKEENGSVCLSADAMSDSSQVVPDLSYCLKITDADWSVVSNDSVRAASLVALDIQPTKEWTLVIQGLLHGEKRHFAEYRFDEEIERYRQFFRSTLNGFRLTQDGQETKELAKINDLSWWYTHNMLVHYSVPHGLEQYGGAAWGTRDVCQGPTEYFLALQKYESVREILKTVYSHQYEDDGNWPQWFMFDQYYRFQQEESHGDIIVWPLKMLSDYLSVTNDYSVLDEQVPFTKRGSFEFGDESYSILEHALKQIEYIKTHFLHDTYLSSYGDGDWDDTLQPANAVLKKYMVSSWTVALTYQVLKQFSQRLIGKNGQLAGELMDLAKGIKEDYNKYMLRAEVIPGFIYMDQPGEAELMLHPSDTKTGIQYRLLPMTRSMIAELLSPEEAEKHFQIIKEKLYHPDGVRLMDQPANYRGGVSTHFKRAEQAANFGREVGLQYVHAHIRFVEAMAKLGKVDEAWDGLERINPVGIHDVVPNAAIRQSNAYFSSSDGDFSNRYEAQERFAELRTGSVPVKGGWRIYSSGPGIYMNQLISNVLGIRLTGDKLILDPVLPKRLDGLELQFMINDKPVTFKYHINCYTISRVALNGEELQFEKTTNTYRETGAMVNLQKLKQQLSPNENVIEITM